MITKNDLRLGKSIKTLRKKSGLTQQELADRVKITQKYIQLLESARRVPSLKLVYRIAKALNVKVKDLLDF